MQLSMRVRRIPAQCSEVSRALSNATLIIALRLKLHSVIGTQKCPFAQRYLVGLIRGLSKVILPTTSKPSAMIGRQ